MFRVCSEYVQSMFRVCSEYVQSFFRVSSEFLQSFFRVSSEFLQSFFRVSSEYVQSLLVVKIVVIALSSASSVSVFGIFIGPESDHWECLSVTDSLTHSLTD